jgi:hypothetical protein
MADPGPDPRPPDLLRKSLKRIRKRELASRLLHAFCIHLLVGLSVLAICLVVDRLLALGGHEWLVAGAVAGAVLLATAARAAFLLRFSLFEAALLADDRLRLKERVSSALFLAAEREAQRDPAWGELIRRDGERCLEGADLRARFPVRVPRIARWILAPAALSIVMALLPPVDLLGLERSRLADSAMKKEVDRKKEELARKIEELRKEARKPLDPLMEKLLESLKKRPPEVEEARKKEAPPAGEEVKREALVEFTRVSETLRKSLDAERFSKLREFLDRFPPGSMSKSPLTGAIRDSLKEGDFGKALAELKKLEDMLSALAQKKDQGTLSREELAKLKELSEELARLAKDSEALSKLSEKLGAASTSLAAMNPRDALQALSRMGDELSSLDRLAEDLKFLEDAADLAELSLDDLSDLHSCPDCGKLSLCRGGRCFGAGKGKPGGLCPGGSGTPKGGGKGGRGAKAGARSSALLGMRGGSSRSTGPNQGQGQGKRDGGTPEDTSFKKETLHPREMSPGQIVGTLPVEGEAPKGEAQVPVTTMSREALQRMAEKVETEVLPAEYREQVLRYMELLRAGTAPETEGADQGRDSAGGEKEKPEGK